MPGCSCVREAEPVLHNEYPNFKVNDVVVTCTSSKKETNVKTCDFNFSAKPSQYELDNGVRTAIQRGCRARLAQLAEWIPTQPTDVLVEWVQYASKCGQMGLAIYLQQKLLLAHANTNANANANGNVKANADTTAQKFSKMTTTAIHMKPTPSDKHEAMRRLASQLLQSVEI